MIMKKNGNVHNLNLNEGILMFLFESDITKTTQRKLVKLTLIQILDPNPVSILQTIYLYLVTYLAMYTRHTYFTCVELSFTNRAAFPYTDRQRDTGT